MAKYKEEVRKVFNLVNSSNKKLFIYGEKEEYSITEIYFKYLPVIRVMRKTRWVVYKNEEFLERVSLHPDVIAFFRNKKLDELL